MEKLGSRSSCSQESWMFASEGSVALEFHSSGRSGRLGQWSRSKSRTCAWTAERHSSSENSTKDSPDKVAADRAEEAMEDAFGLTIMVNESAEASTGRSRFVFTRLQMEGRKLPSDARGQIVLHGCRLGSVGATIMSATRSTWEVEELSTAIHTSFLGCPPDGWSHGAFGVDELKDRVEDDGI